VRARHQTLQTQCTFYKHDLQFTSVTYVTPLYQTSAHVYVMTQSTFTTYWKNPFAKRQKLWAGLPDFSWHNIPKRGKIYQITTTLPNGHKIGMPDDRIIFQMTTKYTSIFHSKALQNLPKFEFLVWKQTIWQPWLWAPLYDWRGTGLYLVCFS
jgi:hypothetical protein